MSRQRFTSSGSVSERKRSMRSWVSTWVSACGWKTSFTPYSLNRTLASSSVPVTRFFHCSVSSSLDSVAVPLCWSVYCSGRCTRYSAPTADEQPGLLAELGDRLVQRVLALVQSGEDRATADREVALGQLLLQLGGVLGHEALGAELGVDVAHGRDLVEVDVPRHLMGIAGEPHAPRVRRGAEAELGEVGHEGLRFGDVVLLRGRGQTQLGCVRCVTLSQIERRHPCQGFVLTFCLPTKCRRKSS